MTFVLDCCCCRFCSLSIFRNKRKNEERIAKRQSISIFSVMKWSLWGLNWIPCPSQHEMEMIVRKRRQTRNWWFTKKLINFNKRLAERQRGGGRKIVDRPEINIHVRQWPHVAINLKEPGTMVKCGNYGLVKWILWNGILIYVKN